MASVFDTISDFISKYFIDPITQHSGYNIVNTVTYAVIFAIGTYFGIKFFEKIRVKIDKKLILSLIPFMILGGTSRALVDAEVYPDTPILITPGIYITIALVTIATMIVMSILQQHRDIDFHRNVFLVGVVLALVNIALIVYNIKRPEGLVYILGSFGALYIPLRLISGRYDTFLKGNEYIVGAHIFDAATTFTGIQFYGYVEQHVLTGYFIDIFGPVVMFPLKIIFITLSLYLLDWIIPEGDFQNLNIKNILKMVILILGLGPGIRNMCTIIMAA
ncbi:MAG TPA: DUF63 family protein [Candidatus Methanofastidiosa archaeon]|nr:DUF63 family protein [Candidatus Methanofastidiosa archaeon]